MFEIVSNSEINLLAELAYDIWHEYWVNLLSSEQIDYMLEKFQSESVIKDQIDYENYTYYFIKFDGQNIGYFGISCKKDYLFLSKIYIKKDFRYNGIGTRAFDEIKKIASKNKYNKIRLTVNKYNKNSINAYIKWGFRIIESVVTDIGKGFVMDDYIMEYR